MMIVDKILDWARGRGYTAVYGSAEQVNEMLTDVDFAASKDATAVVMHLVTDSATVDGKDTAVVAVYFASLCDLDFDGESLLPEQERLKGIGKDLLNDIRTGNEMTYSDPRWQYGYDDYAENVCWVCLRVTITASAADCVPLVIPKPPAPANDYMYFEAQEANSTVSMLSALATAPDLEYSTDGEAWQEWQHTTAEGTHTFDTITLTAVGDRVYLRGVNSAGFLDFENEIFSFFSLTGKIAAGGNAQSLVDGDTPTLVAKTMPFFSDFIITEQPSDVLTQAPALPATTLAESCYYGMFGYCTGLTQAPSLPATTLAVGCYEGMFTGCTGLTQAPSLPATTLADYCYASMFSGCTGLTQAPALPATTLADGCYYGMFDGCTGLTQAPSLPATTLAVGCYEGMFTGCTGLTQAPSLPATTLADYCYASMFSGCTGLTQAPALPATTLADGCYANMFSGCTFNMSDDGTTFNFQCDATLPQTAGGATFNTPAELAGWMGNENGFTNP